MAEATGKEPSHSAAKKEIDPAKVVLPGMGKAFLAADDLNDKVTPLKAWGSVFLWPSEGNIEDAQNETIDSLVEVMINAAMARGGRATGLRLPKSVKTEDADLLKHATAERATDVLKPMVDKVCYCLPGRAGGSPADARLSTCNGLK